MNDRPLHIVWHQCGCYVWPIVQGYTIRKCGYCGVIPLMPAAAPLDGRAHPLPK